MTDARPALGLIVSSFRNPFFGALAADVERAAAARGCALRCASCEDDGRLQVERAAEMLDGGVTALVLTIPHSAATVAAGRVPLVFIDRPPDGQTFVATDGVEGGRLVATHLVQMGYRRPACLVAERGLQSVADRVTGFELALRGMGIELGDERVADCGAFEFAAAAEGAAELVEDGADAIFAINDVLAIGALGALPALELRAGIDVGVVGFDDSPFAALPALDLSSVNQSTAELAVHAVEMAVRSLAAPQAHQAPVMLRPRLVVRGSSRRGG